MLGALTISLTLGLAPLHSFAAGPHDWLMDGKPYLVRSGEMHYARVPRAYWKDRFLRLRSLGLNTVCTYVFWNLHEPEPGEFDFRGQNDIAEYVREAQAAGLNVILRPGPYVCAEWEWGGYPYWLANVPGMQIRQNNPQFLAATGKWLDRLGKELAPLTVNNGGPIILCQVENEYGSFGGDHAYMEAIHRQLHHAGFDCQLYTADGSGHDSLEAGTLPDLPAAINFGGGAPGQFANLAKFRSIGPRMNGEFWCGWFDHWGDRHHTAGIAGEVRDLEWMLDRGDSVNLYMAHGGTSFGYMQGANASGAHGYEPDTTSYDYDAPFAEDGTLTKKFWAFREVFKKHLNPGETIPEPPADSPHIAIPTIELTEVARLLEQLPKPIQSERPLSFEELHHPYGAVVYTSSSSVSGSSTIQIRGLQDRAWAGGKQFLSYRFDRASGLDRNDIHLGGLYGQPEAITIAVESQGRINFSRSLLKERKGFVEALADGKPIVGWNIYPLDLDHPNRLHYRRLPKRSSGLFTTFGSPGPAGPMVYRGSFTLNAVGDTYLRFSGDSDGFIWVNGHNLGRWDAAGPQQALYCPASYLRVGRNEIHVFDMHGMGAMGTVVTSGTKPIFETPPTTGQGV